jgi:ABC-type transport system substrate-binding protein/DNA-binding SARP family transcriptional activator/DNA-binding beta-propeller fold protein YncE
MDASGGDMSERTEPNSGIGTRGVTSVDARSLRFQMLGAIRATLNGSAVNLGGPQQRAVLALLLIDPDSPVPVAYIADALWGERPPPGSATTIQTYVFHLREALEPDRTRGAPAQVLVSDRGGYRLDTRNAAVDAREFEDLARSGVERVRTGEYKQALRELDAALGLWRGDVLADVAELEAVAPVSARLNELRLTTIEARMDALLALGRHALVVGELDELVAADPLRERLHAQRMLALYRCGRQADALAAYRHLRQILDDEIGVEPSPPLSELHQAILAHDRSLTEGLTASVASAPGRVSPSGPTTKRHPGRRRVMVASAAAVIVAAGTAAAVVAAHGERSSLRALPPNSVGLIDADGSLHDAVAVGQSPTAITSAAGSLWVANGGTNTVMRIDPRAHIVIREIAVGTDPVAITATGSDVWVVNATDGTVDRINTDVNRVVGQPIKVGNQPGAIAAGPSGVWVANTGDDTVQRIDPDSSQADPAIAVGGGPDGLLAADANSVWVANGLDGTVSQLNPHSRLVHAPIHVGVGPSGLAFIDGSVWVVNSLEQSVSRIDPTSGVRATFLDVGDGPTAATSDGRFLWVAASHSATVTRIEPRSREVRRFGVGASPVALTALGSSVFIAAQPFAATSHVGGTLTVGIDKLPGTSYGIDPANLYYYWTTAAERFVYDGLIAYRAADGAAGYTLVPDLAARMPDVSQDGKTYTFTVREGIRYSTGRLVQPQDFARGFRRVFTVGGAGNPGLFNGVVGAAGCLVHPVACDLSRGVVADDARHRLTIHLIAADADFLYKLTYFVFPTPPGTSPKQLTTPLPGTGPYQIKAPLTRRNPVDRHPEVVFDTLIPNGYFRQWSFAAQPAGYPDVIKFREYRDAEAAVKAVQAGTIDIGRIPGGDTAKLAHVIAGLQLREPARVHAVVPPGTWWESLNMEVAPFDNQLARQAINYAIDREQVIKDVFGPGVVRPSCQMLPANFPSFEWYCPYTRAGPKPYNGPDLAKARRLVKQSGTRGTQVTVYVIIERPSDHALLADFAKALHDIGYRVSTRTLPDNNASYGLVSDPRHAVQISGKDGWIADYPSADTFYDPLLSCRVKDLDPSKFCNKGIDDLAAAARSIARSDPSKARQLWKQIDKLVTDQAPWVTLGSEMIFHFTARRVGNYQSTPFNPLYDQLWVK